MFRSTWRYASLASQLGTVRRTRRRAAIIEMPPSDRASRIRPNKIRVRSDAPKATLAVLVTINKKSRCGAVHDIPSLFITMAGIKSPHRTNKAEAEILEGLLPAR